MTQHPEGPDHAELQREIGRLTAELDRLAGLLAAERAYFRAELASGAHELARRDDVVEKLKGRRNRLTRQRDRARAKVAAYESSRLVRVAARVARRLHRLRGPG